MKRSTHSTRSEGRLYRAKKTNSSHHDLISVANIQKSSYSRKNLTIYQHQNIVIAGKSSFFYALLHHFPDVKKMVFAFSISGVGQQSAASVRQLTDLVYCHAQRDFPSCKQAVKTRSTSPHMAHAQSSRTSKRSSALSASAAQPQKVRLEFIRLLEVGGAAIEES